MKDSERLYFPEPPIDRDPSAIEKRKRTFAGLNRFVTDRSGWLTSVAGAIDVIMECLPNSTLPDDVARLGHEIRPDGETQRILPAAIEEKFARNGDGTLSPITEGSTRPVAEVRRHAGIVRTNRFSISML